MEETLNKEEPLTAVTDNPCVLEVEIDELISMFNTNHISQEGVVCGCELVRAELYEAQQTH